MQELGRKENIEECEHKCELDQCFNRKDCKIIDLAHCCSIWMDEIYKILKNGNYKNSGDEKT